MPLADPAAPRHPSYSREEFERDRMGETGDRLAEQPPAAPRQEPHEALSISESVTLLKDAIARANTPDGPHPFLFDTLSLQEAKRILGAWADAGLVDGPRGYVLPPVERRFECFFNFLGWWHWSIGLHLDVRHPHIGLHVPFGFVRLGWSRSPTIDHPRAFGYDGWTRERRRDSEARR